MRKLAVRSERMKQAQPLASEKALTEEMLLMHFKDYLNQKGAIT